MRIYFLILLGIASFAVPLLAVPPSPPTIKVRHMDVVDASILWDELQGNESSPRGAIYRAVADDPVENSIVPYQDGLRFSEILGLKNVPPKDQRKYDEFTKRRVIQEFDQKWAERRAYAKGEPVYEVVTTKDLQDYDFTRHQFPTGLKAERFGVAMEQFPWLHVYFVQVDMPEALTSIEMAEADAEKLAGRLRESRAVEVRLRFKPLRTLPEEKGEFLENPRRGIACVLWEGEISIPPVMEPIFKKPANPTEAAIGFRPIIGERVKVPRRVLKTWKLPALAAP